MKTFAALKPLLAALTAAFTAHVLAGDPYAEIRTLSFGQSTDAVLAIQAEITAANPGQLRAIEEKLISVLESRDATRDAKSWVCRTLRLAGSEQCVEAVAACLSDPKLAADAQFALRSLPGKAVDDALRRKLTGTTGLVTVGIIQTLGARGDRASVAAIAPLASAPDPVIAEAALYALGNIGGSPALEVVRKAKPGAKLESYRDHALILCAESALAEGNRGVCAGACRNVFSTSASANIRSAALRNFLLADPDDAAPILREALGAEDRVLRSSAVQLLCESPEKLQSELLGDFSSLSSDTRANILGMITNRAALPVIRTAAKDHDPQISSAALRALGRCGSSADVPLLLAAAQSPPSQAAARKALTTLRDSAVDDALLALIKDEASNVRQVAMSALADRNCVAAVPSLLEATGDSDASVRLEALKALGQLADPIHLKSLLQRLLKSRTPEDREAAEHACTAVVQRAGNSGSAPLESVLSCLPESNAVATCALLRVLAQMPGEKSLKAICAFVAAADPMVQDTAVRCLADWPNATPAPDLLGVIRSTSNTTQRALALRGIVRMAGLPGQAPAEQSQMLAEALPLSTSPAEKRAVLGALAGVNHNSALELAIKCLSDPEIEVEAANATVRLARKLQSSDADAAGAAIQKILDTCKSPAARQMAESAGVILAGMINIAPQGKASSPDGVEKDGQAGDDQAANDGSPASYWDEADNAQHYRFVVTFNRPEKIKALSIMGYAHHNYAPKDFEVLCDGKQVKQIQNAQYTENLLVVPLAETTCQELALNITAYYGASPAIRELGVYRPKSADAPAPEARVLVFSKTLGFRHANIPLGVSAIRSLGEENGFGVDATEDSSAFTSENLRRYRAIVFLSVTGDVLDENQEKAFKEYVLAGGGFVAIHGALFGPSACEEKWAWYGDLCCVSFKNHSAVVPAIVDIEDHAHPSTAGLPARWTRTDEWYNYEGTPRGRAHVLATLDESTYKGGSVGEDHPIAWCKPMGRGVVWYTAMGHTDESFREPLFLKHVLGGIQFAAGMKKGDSSVNPKPARTPAN